MATNTDSGKDDLWVVREHFRYSNKVYNTAHIHAKNRKQAIQKYYSKRPFTYYKPKITARKASEVKQP